MFLGVDTVFDQCSVAVVNKDLQILSCHTEPGKREQTQLILPMIEAALQEAGVKLGDITALFFNHPLGGVSSLSAIAQAASDEQDLEQVYVAFDARMKQVYFAQYQLDSTTQVMSLTEGTNEQLLDYDQGTDFASSYNMAVCLQNKRSQCICVMMLGKPLKSRAKPNYW